MIFEPLTVYEVCIFRLIFKEVRVSMDACFFIISNYHKKLKSRNKRKLEFFQIFSLAFPRKKKKTLPILSAKTVSSENLDGSNKLVLK